MSGKNEQEAESSAPEKDCPTVRVSVRSLVEFILRSGDISRGSGFMDPDVMQKGARLHRKLQKSMGSGYRSETALKLRTDFEDLSILTEGRADGVFTATPQEDGEPVTWIDEIKGVNAPLAFVEEPVPVHRAQAMCYAHMLCVQEGLTRAGVQMTYANLETEEIRRFTEVFTAGELGAWYTELITAYHRWVSFRQKWRRARDLSMKGLDFPFPYRAGQQTMVRDVFLSVRQGRRIFVQAPTGIGKTMSAVFPAVRALGEGYGSTVFYLTARTPVRTVAQDAFRILREKGLSIKTITLTAKEKLCPNDRMQCSPDACPFAKGHFDRVNKAVYELWTTQDCYTREVILDQAGKHRVCPFEMSLDLALWADAVIADYNYVFDPDASLKRFFADGSGGDYILLIDEAHNLADRAREMFSAVLCREEALRAVKLLNPMAPKTAGALRRVCRQLKGCKDRCLTAGEDPERLAAGRPYEKTELPQALLLYLLQVRTGMEALMQDPSVPELSDELLDFYFGIRTFLNVSDRMDDSYSVYSEIGEDGRFYLHLLCVNPAARLEERFGQCRSAVLFSATLHPLDYYHGLLSRREDDYGLYLPSPFDAAHRLILTGTDVSSRYTRRGPEEYARLAAYIAAAVFAKKGNYMVFFPSYQMLDEVSGLFEADFNPGILSCLRQTPGMTEQEREEFLEAFREEAYVVGFAIMGGIFSEGIDLLGDRLIGAVIVGTGLPGISSRGEILKAYYEAHGRNGFDYAYRYPGMNKVLQAAGRVIRTQSDRGIILLLDERFSHSQYRPLFPPEWGDRRRVTLSSVKEELARFWKGDGHEKGL